MLPSNPTECFVRACVCVRVCACACERERDAGLITTVSNATCISTDIDVAAEGAIWPVQCWGGDLCLSERWKQHPLLLFLLRARRSISSFFISSRLYELLPVVHLDRFAFLHRRRASERGQAVRPRLPCNLRGRLCIFYQTWQRACRAWV